MRRTASIILAAGVLGGAASAAAQEAGTGLPSLVIEVASDSLRDVAVAVYTPVRGIIYYNPALLEQAGPELARFFRAHEFGHLFHHHTRGNAMLGGNDDGDAVLQRNELEADCYATRRLAAEHPEALDAAIRFFSRMGGIRYDREHPSGSERAAAILACLPTPEGR
jgi:hypothetical protein